MQMMFIDESGNHNLQVIDADYPVFVLAGVIMDEAAAAEAAIKLAALKVELFGRQDIILHTADIVRKRNGFESLRDAAFQRHFYNLLNQYMDKLSYKIVACVIDKRAHIKRYGELAFDVYEYSLGLLVERFCYQLKGEQGIIQCERRGKLLDRRIELEWQRLQNDGTRYLAAAEIRRKILSLKLHHKHENIAGLQIADLAASPIGRQFIGKASREDMNIIKRKILQNNEGKSEWYGMILLPK